MADPDQSSLKIEPYTVDNGGGWTKPKRRVRLRLKRKDAWGSRIASFDISISERVLLKALGDAGYYVHPRGEEPR